MNPDEYDLYCNLNKRPQQQRSVDLVKSLDDRHYGYFRNNVRAKEECELFAEEQLIFKEHFDEMRCEMPGLPRSTFLMVFSPDGTKVASTHGNHNIYVSDLRSGKNVKTLVGHPRTPWCIAFHPTSDQIVASGCLGGQVRIWDLSGGSEVWTAKNESVIASIAFHPNDRILVIATFNEVYFWDWSKPEPFCHTSTGNQREKVRYVAFDKLGQKLITGISNSPQSRWDRVRAPVPVPRQAERTSSPYRRRMPRMSNLQSRVRPQSPVPREPPREPLSSVPERERNITACYRNLVREYGRLVQRYLQLYRPPTMIDRGTDPMEPVQPRFNNGTQIPQPSTSTQSVEPTTSSATTSESQTEESTASTQNQPLDGGPSTSQSSYQLLTPSRMFAIMKKPNKMFKGTQTTERKKHKAKDGGDQTSEKRAKIQDVSSSLRPARQETSVDSEASTEIGIQTQSPRKTLVISGETGRTLEDLTKFNCSVVLSRIDEPSTSQSVDGARQTSAVTWPRDESNLGESPEDVAVARGIDGSARSHRSTWSQINADGNREGNLESLVLADLNPAEVDPTRLSIDLTDRSRLIEYYSAQRYVRRELSRDSRNSVREGVLPSLAENVDRLRRTLRGPRDIRQRYSQLPNRKPHRRPVVLDSSSDTSSSDDERGRNNLASRFVRRSSEPNMSGTSSGSSNNHSNDTSAPADSTGVRDNDTNACQGQTYRNFNTELEQLVTNLLVEIERNQPRCPERTTTAQSAETSAETNRSTLPTRRPLSNVESLPENFPDRSTLIDTESGPNVGRNEETESAPLPQLSVSASSELRAQSERSNSVERVPSISERVASSFDRVSSSFERVARGTGRLPSSTERVPSLRSNCANVLRTSCRRVYPSNNPNNTNDSNNVNETPSGSGSLTPSGTGNEAPSTSGATGSSRTSLGASHPSFGFSRRRFVWNRASAFMPTRLHYPRSPPEFRRNRNYPFGRWRMNSRSRYWNTLQSNVNNSVSSFNNNFALDELINYSERPNSEDDPADPSSSTAYMNFHPFDPPPEIPTINPENIGIGNMYSNIVQDLESSLNDVRNIRASNRPGEMSDMLSNFSERLENIMNQSETILRNLRSSMEMLPGPSDSPNEPTGTEPRLSFNDPNFYVRDPVMDLQAEFGPPTDHTYPRHPDAAAGSLTGPGNEPMSPLMTSLHLTISHIQRQARLLRQQVESIERIDRAMVEVAQLQLIRLLLVEMSRYMRSLAGESRSTCMSSVRLMMAGTRISDTNPTDPPSEAGTSQTRTPSAPPVVDQAQASTSSAAPDVPNSSSTSTRPRGSQRKTYPPSRIRPLRHWKRTMLLHYMPKRFNPGSRRSNGNQQMSRVLETLHNVEVPLRSPRLVAASARHLPGYLGVSSGSNAENSRSSSRSDGGNNARSGNPVQDGSGLRRSGTSQALGTKSSGGLLRKPSSSGADSSQRSNNEAGSSRPIPARTPLRPSGSSNSSIPSPITPSQYRVNAVTLHRMARRVDDLVTEQVRQLTYHAPAYNLPPPRASSSLIDDEASEQTLTTRLRQSIERTNVLVGNIFDANHARTYETPVSRDGLERFMARQTLANIIDAISQHLVESRQVGIPQNIQGLIQGVMTMSLLLSELLLLQIVDSIPPPTGMNLDQERLSLTNRIDQMCSLMLSSRFTFHSATLAQSLHVMRMTIATNAVIDRRISIMRRMRTNEFERTSLLGTLNNTLRMLHRNFRNRSNSTTANNNDRTGASDESAINLDESVPASEDPSPIAGTSRSSNVRAPNHWLEAERTDDDDNDDTATNDDTSPNWWVNAWNPTRRSPPPPGTFRADNTTSMPSTSSADGARTWPSWSVPSVQVNDVPISNVNVTMSVPSYMQNSRFRVSERIHDPRSSPTMGFFRPRFLHPLYASVNPFDADLDEQTREIIYESDMIASTTVTPNHRIQVWDMSESNIPVINNPMKNIVVNECKIHNSASVDIASDGTILVTLLPSGGYLNVTNRLGIYSLRWETLGQCLYTTNFDHNAVSVSLSPLSRYLVVGLASRRVSIMPSERWTMARIFNIAQKDMPCDRLPLVRELEQSRDGRATQHKSVNCIRWLPVSGQGLIYATNTGQLVILT